MMAKADGHNEQWKTVRFDKFFSMLPTNTLSRDKLNSQRGTYQNIHYGDVLIKYPFCLDCDKYDIPYINDDVKFNATEVKDGDVIFADTAEDDTVGKCVEVLNVGDRKIVSGLHTYFCRPKYKTAAGYLGYFLNSNHFHNQLLPYIAGSKVSSVNRTSIARTYISYPNSLPAQRRIAAILSSADKVIEQTRQLIGKYKSIKQGMMEDLLKPKEGWKKMKLGDCCIRLCNGMTYDIEEKTGHLVTRIETISEGYIDYSKVGHTNYLPKQEYKLVKGDILFSHINSIKHIGKVAYYDDDIELYHGMNLLVIRTDNKIDSKYLFYQLTSENVRKEIRALAKSAVNQASINTTELQKFEINFPFKNDVPDLPEQRRIAKILSGIDRKIEAEEKVLEKYEKMKKGLMERVLEE